MAKLFKINLQLCAEGGDGAAAGGDTAAVTGAPEADPAAAQTGDNGADPAAQEDRQAQYAKFKKDFEAEHKAEVEGIVKNRLKKAGKENAQLTSKLKAYSPIIEAIAKQYGVDPENAEELLKAYEADDKNLEEEAFSRDMSVDALRQFKEIERENESYRMQEEERKRDELFAKWDREAEELKEFYPSFNIAEEMENESFMKLIGNNVPMKTAYEVAHKDEIIRGAMQYTANKTAEKVANSVKANSARPAENGLSSQAAAVSRVDINSLTREQIATLKQRALNGERIDFVKNF